MKKTKIFLGAYINRANAQNLNCLALATHLNKKKFDIYTMSVYSGKMDIKNIEGVEMFHCSYPHKISKYIAYLWGIWNCDVAYLPKGENWKWNQFLLWLFGKKSISTVESILDSKAMTSLIERYGNLKSIESYFYSFDRLYSITHFMAKYNEENWDLRSESDILYLGSDIDMFMNKQKTILALSEVILIGNDLVRKGIDEYFVLASKFPNITFHIVGTGNGKIDVLQEIEGRKLINVIFHSGMKPDELVVLLRSVDLNILPSRSEGFPKVILETAASGVPSLIYKDYGANEWIEDNVNGFLVDSIEGMIYKITQLSKDSTTLTNASKNSIQLAKKFDWKIKIKEWEKVFEEID